MEQKTEATVVNDDQTCAIFQPDLDDLVYVRLLGGKVELVKRRNILGTCHNLTHPGKLTKTLIKKHGCIPKQCPFFKKNPETPYWIEMERQQEKRRILKQERKAEARDAAKKLEELKAEFQSYFDDLEHPVRVIRVEQLKPNVFQLFYVSDNDFPDGSLYRDFYHILWKKKPACKVLLRHIKDLNGHFVTREEYRRRFG